MADRTLTLRAELISEFLGTFILMLFGEGVVAMVVLFGKGIPGEIVNGGYTNITLAWGIAVTMGIYVSSRISGAHLNPAVTIAMALFRDFSWRKVLPFCLTQIFAAFCAAALVYWNYKPQFDKFDPARNHTANVFTTFPAFPDLFFAGMTDQVIGTALLLLCICAVTDERNAGPPRQYAPILVGLSVIAIGMAFGAMHGYAINPARDFGPRLFTVVAGFRNNGLTDGSFDFIVPIVGPIIGACMGVFIYDRGIAPHLPSDESVA